MKEWKAGDYVRYGDGETALCKLISPHAGGWYARQCFGGVLFVSDNGWSNRMTEFSDKDHKTWNLNDKYRTKYEKI